MHRLSSTALVALLIATGCSSSRPEPASLALYVFDCGRLNYDSLEGYGIADDETDVRDLVVPCYVVEHEKGRLLWEGGLPSSYSEQAGWHEMEGGWRMRLDRTFADQLAALGWSLRDFDFMAFSHFHFDHIGVANEVEGATLIIQRREHEAAFGEDFDRRSYSPELYSRLAEGPMTIVDGEHDVFGDGRVRLLPAFGHTPGHQVLFLDLDETGPVVLSGDLYVFRISRETRRVPSFYFDPAQSLEASDRIESFLEETGAELWIGHDLQRFEQLAKPPAFHD